MGDVSAQASIDRVLRHHGDEIKERLFNGVSGEIRPYLEPVLENNVASLQVVWLFRGLPGMGDGQQACLEGPEIGIDALAEDFPCCEVSY